MERRHFNLTLEELGSEFQGHTESEDLRFVLDFFGIEPNSPETQQLTGLTPEDINGILDGSVQASSRRVHSAILGEFTRASKKALGEFSSKPINNKGLRQWLQEGQVKTSEGIMKPIDALSDSQLALDGLHEVQAANAGAVS